jgi:hypothetical protein
MPVRRRTRRHCSSSHLWHPVAIGPKQLVPACCNPDVPIAYLTADGSGHKGSRSLRTSGKGPWQRAVKFGEMGAAGAAFVAMITSSESKRGRHARSRHRGL